MAHRITATENTEGETTYSFARHANANTAWHGLGQVIEPVFADDIGYWREQSGLGYRFEMQELLDARTGLPATYDRGRDLEDKPTAYGRPVRIWELGEKAGVEEGAGVPFTLGDNGYEPTDPELLFVEVTAVKDAAIAAGLVDAAECFIDCAGSLRKDNRQFVTLHLPAVEVDGDRQERWLSRVSSCDASAANSANQGTLRVVCDNTAAIALTLTKAMAGQKKETRGWKFTSASSGGARFLHRRGGNDKMAAALGQFADAMGYSDALVELINQLSRVSVTNRQFQAICDDLWAPPEKTTPDTKLTSGAARQAKTYYERVDVLQQQWAIESERGGKTGWSALQPITHVLSRRQAGGRELSTEGLLEIRLFGADVGGDAARAAKLTERAFDGILARGSVASQVLVPA